MEIVAFILFTGAALVAYIHQIFRAYLVRGWKAFGHLFGCLFFSGIVIIFYSLIVYKIGFNFYPMIYPIGPILGFLFSYFIGEWWERRESLPDDKDRIMNLAGGLAPIIYWGFLLILFQ